MEVFRGSKSVLIQTFLYKESDLRVCCLKIPQVLMNILYAVPMAMNIALMVYCIFVKLTEGGGLKEISASCYIALGTLSAILIYLSLASHLGHIFELVQLIESVVHHRSQQSDESKEIYTKCGVLNDIFVRRIMLFVVWVSVTTLAGPILSPIGNAIFGFSKPHLWYFPFPVAVWWDTTHTLGYYVALVPQIVACITYMMTIAIMITFFGGICEYVQACVDEMSTIIPQMNEIAANDPTKGRNYGQIGLQLQQTIASMIKLHTDILRMMDLFGMIVSGPIFYQLLVYVVFLALNLLQFDDNIHNFSLAMALNVNALINQIAFNFVICNYSSNVLSKVSTVANIALDARWYEFPVAQQKLFPFVIQRSQKPIQLTGFGIITCSVETYLALFKSALSYFVVFRRFR